jgi:hypothetical protein
MPRQNTGQEVWKSLSSLQVFRQVPAGGSTTAAAAITAGATAVNFGSTATFASGDPLFIVGATGTELNAITAVTPSTAVPLLYPAQMANPSGSQLLEAVATDLGHLDQSGLVIDPQSPLAAVFSALGHTPIAYLRGYGELMAQVALLGFNILNLQTLFGTTESEAGTGTSGSPYSAAIVGASVGTQGIQCVRATGLRVDGSTVILDLNNAVIAPRGGINLSRGVVTTLPLEIRFQSWGIRIYS